MEIKGNLESIRNTVLNELEELYDFTEGRGEFVPVAVVEKICYISEKINREIALYLDRRGKVLEISIGDSKTAPLSKVDGRRDRSRLSGFRCIHTHPSGSGLLSSPDISSMLSLRLDAMIALGVKDGKCNEIFVGIPKRKDNEFKEADLYGPFDIGDPQLNYFFGMITEIEKDSVELLHDNDLLPEKAILVGIESGNKIINEKTEGQRLLDELEELATTAGAVVVTRLLQKNKTRDSGRFLGKGKLEELALMRQTLDADLLIFDDELTGSQVRNIEEATGAKVIDRATLILDIFAARAKSKEGKLQVELAQLKYRLPRLIGLGGQMSRLGGGIGTRGPGEKKLEVDKRHIRKRVNILENELEDVSKRRDTTRKSRNEIPVVAIVGYTNAGKSTLLNNLCKSDVLAEDMLFATLDPATRGLELSDGRQLLVVDTVGFIRKLPHDLIEAFKSSLEEAVFADVLIHVVDVSNEELEEHIKVVNKLLEELGALNKPVILALNKCDINKNEENIHILNPYGPVLEISAKNNIGLEELIENISNLIPEQDVMMEIFVPYKDGWVLPYIHQNGIVLEEDYLAEDTRISAKIRKDKASKLDIYRR